MAARALPWLIVLPLLIIALARLVAHDITMPLLWLNAFTGILYLPAIAVLLWALRQQRRALAATSGVVVGLWALWCAPSLPAALPPEAGPTLRIFSGNLLMVHPDPAAIVAEIQAADADVLLLQEYSPRWQEALTAAGVLAAYPEGVSVVREDSFGTAIFSRQPLRSAELLDVEGLPMSRVEIDLGERPTTLLNVHTLPPRTYRYTDIFRDQMRWLAAASAARTGPLAMIGDFNATRHSADYQRLLATGLRSAHDDRGRSLATTFPNGLFPLPPIRLDHALLSPELTCRSITEGQGEGSDHRPLLIALSAH